MLVVTEAVKRPYRMNKRDDLAHSNRIAIRTAAHRLFVDNGYAMTSMRQIADNAGVGERTLYDAFRTKADLFFHVVGVAIAGDELPVPVIDRPEFRTALQEADAASAIDEYVAFSVDILERAGDLIMVAIKSSGSDENMRAFDRDGAEATRRTCREMATALHKMGALRVRVSSKEATDILFVLSSPVVHDLFRRQSKWTRKHYERWLREAIAAQLLEV